MEGASKVQEDGRIEIDREREKEREREREMEKLEQRRYLRMSS